MTQNATTLAFVGADGGTGTPDATGVVVKADLGNFTLGSSSNWSSQATTESDGGGLFGSAHATSKDTVNYTTQATVGAGAAVTAAQDVAITSDAKTGATTKATALFIGIDVGSYADADSATDSTGGVIIGSASTPALSKVEVGKGATIMGQTVALKATQSSMNASATDSARSINPILIGVNVAFAISNVSINSSTNVAIDPDPKTLITGTQGVDVIADQAAPTVSRNPYAIAVALIPPQDGSAAGTATFQNSVVGGAGATVEAGVRSSTGPLENKVLDTKGKGLSNLALNVQSFDQSETGVDSHSSQITWDSNVVVDSSNPVASLVIAHDGTITQDNGVTATDGSGNPLSVGSVVPAGSSINVTTNAQGGTAYFYGKEAVQNSATYPLFTFAASATQVDITNNSDRPLNIKGIDVVPDTTPSEVRLDGPNLATVSNTVPFNFDIANSAAPALVDIENLDTTSNPSDVTLVGPINNPIGQTIIHNVRGNILSSSAAGLVRTNDLTLNASGNIGGGLTTDPVYVQLVQSLNSLGTILTPEITANSTSGTINLDLTGRQRDGNNDPLTIKAGTITAAEGMNLALEQGLIDSAGKASGGLLVCRPQTGDAADYFTHFYLIPSLDIPSNAQLGAFASSDNANALTYPSTFDFQAHDASGNLLPTTPGLTSGGNITVSAVDSSSQAKTITIIGTVDLNPASNPSPGVLTSVTNGPDTLTEIGGAMRVGTIESTQADVTLRVSAADPTGDDLTLGSGAAVYAPNGSITANVADNVDANVGSVISTRAANSTATTGGLPTASVTIVGDFGRTTAGTAGSDIFLAGKIFTPDEEINGGARNDVIGLTNVTPNTFAHVNVMSPSNTINLASPVRGMPFQGGVLSTSLLGPVEVLGTNGTSDTLNIDDKGDAAPQSAFLDSTTVSGLGMTQGGVGYTGVQALNLDLGTAPDTVNVNSSALGTTSTITAQVTGNTWNVGSKAPTLGTGILDGVAGPVVLNGVSNGTTSDVLNIDDKGSTKAKTGTLTDSLLTGLGMTGSVAFHEMSILNVNLGSGGNALTATITNNLPLLTNIDGGTSSSDSFTGTWANNFNGALNLTSFETASVTVAKEFFGAYSDASPGTATLLSVGGSLNVGSSVSVQSLGTLYVGHDDDINLNIPGAPNVSPALGTATIGGSIVAGVTLSAASIGSLTVGSNTALAANDHDLAGDVTVTGDAGTIDDVLGAIPTSSTIQVGGNLNTLTVGPPNLSVGQNMAGLVNVTGTLGTTRIAGGTPGLFRAGHVGTLGAYGGFGPVVMRVIEAGVTRWVEEDPAGQVFSQPDANAVAGSPYINTQYLYESATFANPQVSARITNNVSTSPDQFDLSTVVFQDGGTFNLNRLDASGVSGLRNVAVEGSLVAGTSAASTAFFLGDASPSGVDLPSDSIAGVAVRDYVPNGSIAAKTIEGVAFGSFTNTNNVVAPGTTSSKSRRRTPARSGHHGRASRLDQRTQQRDVPRTVRQPPGPAVRLLPRHGSHKPPVRSARHRVHPPKR